MRLWCVLTCVLLLAPLAQAQSPDAPHPSPVDFRLYANGDGSNEYEGWMNTLLDEPDNGDTAMGSTESCYGVPVEELDPHMDRTYTYAMDPGLTGNVYLDGTVRFVLYVGASSADNTVDLEVFLDNGETRVAHGEKKEHTFTEAGSGLYKLVTWEVEPEAATIDTSGLVWTIRMTHDACNSNGAFVGVAADRGRSHVELPIVGTDAPYSLPEPPLTYVNVTRGEFRMEADWQEESNRTQYNWTPPAGDLDLLLQGRLEQGSAQISILNSTHATLFNTTLNGTINGTQVLQATNDTAGWRVFVHATEATGNLSLIIRAAVGELPDPGNGTEPVANVTKDDQGTPGPGIAVAPALGMAAWLLRRRT